MQLIPGFQAPPPLSDPSWLHDFFLERSWIPGMGLVLVGAVIALWHQRRDRLGTGLRWFGALGLGGFGVWLVGWLVHTPREQVLEATEGLTRSVLRGDWAGARDRLGEGATLDFSLARGLRGREEIVGQMRRLLEGSYRLADWGVLDVQAEVRGETEARSQVLVRVITEREGAINFSWWSISWKREGEAWRAGAIVPLAIQGVSEPAGHRN